MLLITFLVNSSLLVEISWEALEAISFDFLASISRLCGMQLDFNKINSFSSS
jgi:hypothetical protein